MGAGLNILTGIKNKSREVSQQPDGLRDGETEPEGDKHCQDGTKNRCGGVDGEHPGHGSIFLDGSNAEWEGHAHE